MKFENKVKKQFCASRLVAELFTRLNRQKIKLPESCENFGTYPPLIYDNFHP